MKSKVFKIKKSGVSVSKLTLYYGNSCLISDIFTLENFRGLGYATKLIESSKLFAKNLKFKSVGLFVSPENEKAIKLYQKNGFKKITDTGEDEIYMICTL